MFYLLMIAAVLSFLAHVGFLIASFPAGGFSRSRYFLSHAMLWLTGLFVFLLVAVYAGTGHSEFLDYFDTLPKKLLVLLATVVLSGVAHSIVRLLVTQNRRRHGK